MFTFSIYFALACTETLQNMNKCLTVIFPAAAVLTQIFSSDCLVSWQVSSEVFP